MPRKPIIEDGLTPQQRYDRKNVWRLTITFNRKTEPELVEWVQSKDRRQSYIRQLIREDIKRTGKSGS